MFSVAFHSVTMVDYELNDELIIIQTFVRVCGQDAGHGSVQRQRSEVTSQDPPLGPPSLTMSSWATVGTYLTPWCGHVYNGDNKD